MPSSRPHDGKVQMIDSSIVRVHQQAAAQKNRMETLVSVEVVEADDEASFAGDRQRPACADRIVARPDG